MPFVGEMSDSLLLYDLPAVTAFSTRRDSSLPYSIVRAHQVHGIRVAIVEDVAAELHKEPNLLTREDLWGYDALVTAIPHLPIAVRTADCIPVLLSDPVRGVVSAIHAGWRGTVGLIVNETIKMMQRRFGSQPNDLYAQIGPGIALSSFQVGAEVVEQFRSAGFPMDRILQDNGPAPSISNFSSANSLSTVKTFSSENNSMLSEINNPLFYGLHIDLFAANSWVLEQSGVVASRIQVVGIDTYTDTSFFSARREGTACGRIHSVICLC